MCRRGVDDLALIPEKHISVCPSLRGLDDDYEEVKAAAQETSTLGAPGYSDFCGAVNSTQGETLHHILAAVKGILHQKIFYRLNLIFWIVLGCGIARFGRRGLKTTET